MSDYSSGYFAGQVGVPRLLRLFKKHAISSDVTWFIPGHSMETFPTETKMIVDSGAEIACHGYAHEGSAQMTEAQEKEVIAKCVQLATDLSGKKPRGWRAPLYQIRENTVKVLEEHGFLYGKPTCFLESTSVPTMRNNSDFCESGLPGQSQALTNARYISYPSRLQTLFPSSNAAHNTH